MLMLALRLQTDCKKDFNKHDDVEARRVREISIRIAARLVAAAAAQPMKLLLALAVAPAACFQRAAPAAAPLRLSASTSAAVDAFRAAAGFDVAAVAAVADAPAVAAPLELVARHQAGLIDDMRVDADEPTPLDLVDDFHAAAREELEELEATPLDLVARFHEGLEREYQSWSPASLRSPWSDVALA